ncbi:putative membrane protein (TIGR02234 family) [Microbacterium terrae]|uniref:Tryptophan-associated transmembrane protein (Trp-oprn-chp) n=1 Tax=Microbacterium terrae TaxID=69369 RepID=A0A0M2GW78_9MICO|nr:Trp biosynthesis-associated membrane protein [Microbacterium terrae]KJL37994.1 Tryptophan-associated transmembrane protein (Trp-oprn-chp) [Microbacterium terrae]MBP1077403.1 putative membrane protein (TIGR02234 family) [Microbacterium terrae]GLJ99013.1 membrane protein [Microbacterium terrae]
MTRRAKLLAVLVILACGALGVISSTQTWLDVTLDDGAGHVLAVPGASAVPVLAPLSLAVLALGGALTIVGRVLRYVFGALTVAIAGILGWLSASVAFSHPTSAITATVTEATGITGEESVAALVAQITSTAWPGVTLASSLVLLAAGVLTLATAHRWQGSDRRYRTDADATAGAHTGARPHDAAQTDAIESWDELSRGEDPTV